MRTSNLIDKANYRLDVAYNGKDYFGFQSQPNGNTIQDHLESSLKTILRCETKVVGGSRTDSGVHAADFHGNSEFCGYYDCDIDGGIRANSNHEILDSLKVIFDENGTVTAATSSPLTDGAATVLVCEEKYAKDNNLEILGRIVSTAVEGCDPDYMGLGPIEATRKALKRANLSIKDIDIIELNEAFASQSLACIQDLEIDINKVNLDGGAISLGHPLGATGARITGKAAELLVRENKKYALATQCIGYGMGIATVIEAVIWLSINSSKPIWSSS